MKNFKVLSVPNSKEFDAVLAFLDWQGSCIKTEVSYEALRYSKGHTIPILIDEDYNVIAKGFLGIIDYYVNHGAILC